jgi:hypothetical protein
MALVKEMKRVFGAALALAAGLVIVAACGSGAGSQESGSVEDGSPSEPSEVQILTGARTRVVWVQDVARGNDYGSKGEELLLMGYDSHDGLGERPLLPAPDNYAKPLITPLGNRVVFSDRLGLAVFVVNWDGSGLRKLGNGIALATWIDPETKTEWVYLGKDMETDPVTFGRVTRHLIDRWDQREVVWDRRRVSPDTFQVSADGRLAGGLYPWPHAGVAELPKGRWRRLGRGCWTGLAGGGSSLFWIFDGSHRNLTLVDIDRDERWQVNINNAPGIDGYEVYHPRWSNHPRFLAVTGPYTVGKGENKIRAGGPQVEIYLGRFAADFTSVESWVKVSNNRRGDFSPDVWIDPSERPATKVTREIKRDPVTTSTASEEKPTEQLVVEVRVMEAAPMPTPQSILPYRRAMLVNEYEIVRVLDGDYQGKKILVAHWVIRDGQVLATATRESGSLHRLTLEAYDEHPELEGERLVMDSDAFELRLYYDVDS